MNQYNTFNLQFSRTLFVLGMLNCYRIWYLKIAALLHKLVPFLLACVRALVTLLKFGGGGLELSPLVEIDILKLLPKRQQRRKQLVARGVPVKAKGRSILIEASAAVPIKNEHFSCCVQLNYLVPLWHGLGNVLSQSMCISFWLSGALVPDNSNWIQIHIITGYGSLTVFASNFPIFLLVVDLIFNMWGFLMLRVTLRNINI